MTKKLSSMSVYSNTEVKNIIAKYLTATLVCIFITAAMALLIFSDIASVILCTVLAYILLTTMLEKRMERINYIVYTQLKYAMESIRLEYMRCGDVVESLETASYGNRIAKIMESIHGVLISTHGDLRLKEFLNPLLLNQFKHWLIFVIQSIIQVIVQMQKVILRLLPLY